MAQASEVCNIGPRERAIRRTSGWVMSAVSVALGLALWLGGAPRLWRAALFVPLFLAAVGFLQARHKT